MRRVISNTYSRHIAAVHDGVHDITIPGMTGRSDNAHKTHPVDRFYFYRCRDCCDS